MNQVKLKRQIEQLIEEDALWKFYKTKEWKELKKQILKKNHNECEECKKNGVITKADTVHHVMKVREHPQLALSEVYQAEDGSYRNNLIPVCKPCHNKLHPEKRKQMKSERFINEERW